MSSQAMKRTFGFFALPDAAEFVSALTEAVSANKKVDATKDAFFMFMVFLSGVESAMF
jgi:hypothetical protein